VNDPFSPFVFLPFFGPPRADSWGDPSYNDHAA
jgi:hypothetical protein